MLGVFSIDPWTICPVSEITELNQKRAGIIVYTYQTPGGVSPRASTRGSDSELELKFVMGLDTEHKDLTDLGGRVKKGETAIEAAIREFQEESQWVFGYLRRADIRNCIALFSVDLLLIFVRLMFNRHVISDAFRKRVDKAEDPEVCKLFLISLEDFQNAIRDEYKYKIYQPVKLLLSRIPDFLSFAASLP